MYNFKTKGVCAREINFSIEEGVIKDIYFIGGCDGNLQGISALVKDMDIDSVIERVQGIRCGKRKTSCPDQLSKALIEYKNSIILNKAQ